MLPNEIWNKIFFYLDNKDLLSVACTNNIFNKLANYNILKAKEDYIKKRTLNIFISYDSISSYHLRFKFDYDYKKINAIINNIYQLISYNIKNKWFTEMSDELLAFILYDCLNFKNTEEHICYLICRFRDPYNDWSEYYDNGKINYYLFNLTSQNIINEELY